MFRALGKSKIAFVLAILFGISLFFFKSGSRYSNFFNSDSVVAKVSNTSISTTKFNRVMQNSINKFNQILNKQITSNEINAFQIQSLALNSLINEAIFEDEYNDINLKIDETIIALKTKEKIPQLYDSKNKLNELYLKSFLQQQQLKIEDIVQIINFETVNKYFSDAFFNINYPKHFSKKINNLDNHSRSISYIELPLDKIKVENSLNIKNELQKFYNDNIDRYMSDEKRDVEYFIIDKNLSEIDFSPTDFEITEYYQTNKKLFYENEKRSFIQFNFKTNEEAIKFKKLIKGFKLNDIIKLSKENDFSFNEFINLKENEILSQIADPLFGLKVNEQSDIIETSLAKHIVILKSITNAEQFTLNQVKDEIQKTIEEIEMNNYYNDLLDKTSQKIIEGESFDNIISDLNLKKGFIKDLTRTYKNSDDKIKFFLDSLIESSFSSNQDFVSDVININENTSYVFNVTKIIQPEPLNFKSIDKIVEKDWKISKKIETFNLDFEKNKDNEMYLNDIANKYNININKMIVTNNSTEIPPNFLNKIFKKEKYEILNNILENKFYIGKIEDIIIDNNENANNDIAMNKDLRDSFSQELIKTKKISTNDGLIKALVDQY